MTDISLIAFDADDTLWECQTYFETVENEFCALLSDYASQREVSEALFATETANMPLLGYGSKAFILSLLETATKLSNNQLKASEVEKIIGLGKQLLQMPGKPMEGVEETLRQLQTSARYRLVVFTKGDLLDQEGKYRRSGLCHYFHDIVVVSDKTPEAYAKLCRQFDTAIDNLLMVGNSFRSDIEPVLQLGGWAAHVPFHRVWQHEVVDEYEHPRLVKVEKMKDLLPLLL